MLMLIYSLEILTLTALTCRQAGQPEWKLPNQGPLINLLLPLGADPCDSETPLDHRTSSSYGQSGQAHNAPASPHDGFLFLHYFIPFWAPSF
jgi:hypothetical protein